MNDLIIALDEMNKEGQRMTREAEEATELLRKARERFEAKLYARGGGSAAMDAFTDGHSRYDR